MFQGDSGGPLVIMRFDKTSKILKIDFNPKTW